MIERWDRLGEALGADGGWGDAEVSAALDLLGVLPELRRGRTPVDRADGTDPAAYRAELIRREVDRLERRLSDSLEALDDLARRQAEVGAMLPLTGPGQLLIRYGRDAWRRYHRAMKAVQARPSESEPGSGPAPAPARFVEEPEESEPLPEPEEPRVRERFPTTPEEIRATLAAIESRLHTAKTDDERQWVLREMDAAMVMLGPELGLDISSILPAPTAQPNRHARRALEARSRRA